MNGKQYGIHKPTTTLALTLGLGLGTILSPSLTTSAHANEINSSQESIREIQVSMQQKQRLADFLQHRLTRHRDARTSLNEIKNELIHSALNYERSMIQNGHNVRNLRSVIAAQIDSIRSIHDKDMLIEIEEAQYQNMMTSENCIGAITLALVDSSQHPGQGYLLMFTLFSVPLDMALLPFEILATLLTGGFDY